MSSPARSLASTNAPSIRIISRIPATLRWLNACTPAADKIADDNRLKIGEGQDEIGPQCKDLVDVRRREGADPRLLAASLRRADDIAGGGGRCGPARPADRASQRSLQ